MTHGKSQDDNVPRVLVPMKKTYITYTADDWNVNGTCGGFSCSGVQWVWEGTGPGGHARFCLVIYGIVCREYSVWRRRWVWRLPQKCRNGMAGWLADLAVAPAGGLPVE